MGNAKDHIAVSHPDKNCIVITSQDNHDSFSYKKSFPATPTCVFNIKDQIYCFGLNSNRVVIMDL